MHTAGSGGIRQFCKIRLKIGKQEAGTPFSKLLDPHLMQQ
jgi:hypothetical protein